eukprot:gnl/TRDRNA2_/TRDRNA2_181776_c0_seq1.p1 gnl/TRDRNA2_/TRDRNA2_181776_c0~~gnl/TRDRNA2_/TRDRNA2_181776_c0_seq1.p1  ORF type:complete len:282 (+),score=56.38 gnl/TRDRNA2_/TRDRNA2_181776_c0_seq1:99-848(+)
MPEEQDWAIKVKVDKKSGQATSIELSDKPSEASVLFDDKFAIAIVTMDENASEDSLMGVIDVLYQRSPHGKHKVKIKVVVLFFHGHPKNPFLQSWGVRSGNFMVGLRSVGFPIVLACSGYIAGPSWGIVLATDYKFASIDTKFVTPVTTYAACIDQICGPSIATQLCMTTGELSTAEMVDINVMTEGRPNINETKKAAVEFAQRMCGYPTLACRQTMSLMGPRSYEYANVVYHNPTLEISQSQMAAVKS